MYSSESRACLAILTRLLSVFIDVLGIDQTVLGIDDCVNAPDSSLCEHLLVGLAVIVPVEDHPLVRFQHLDRNCLGTGTGLDLVGKDTKGLCKDTAEHSVHKRRVRRGAHGTELEAMAAVRERRSAVAVFCW